MALMIEAQFLDKASPKISKLNNNLGTLDGRINKASDTFLGLNKNLLKVAGGFLAVDKALDIGRTFINTADTATQLNSRLSLVVDSSKELRDVQAQLFKTSQDARVGLESTTNLYTQIARSTDELGISSTRLLNVTNNISKALTVSGASATSADAALTQLAQGFASGQLRGEELNSVLEQTPRLAQAIADGLGTNVGGLRELAEAGQLTTETVLTAIESQAGKIQQEFKQIEVTFSQSVVNLQNSGLKIVGELNKELQITNSLATAVQDVSSFIDENQQEIVKYARTTAAVFSKTGDGIYVVYKTLEVTGKNIILGITATVSGALKPIFLVLEKTTEALNAINLSSDESLASIRKLSAGASVVLDTSLNELVKNQNELKDAINQASISIEDRIKLSEVEAELSRKTLEYETKRNSLKQSSPPIAPIAIPSTSKQKDFEAFSIEDTLEKEYQARQQFNEELANLSKSQTQIELEELQKRYEANKQYVDQNTVAYQNYQNRVLELEQQLTEEKQAQRLVDLENQNTALAGIQAGIIDFGNTAKGEFEIMRQASSSFIDSFADGITSGTIRSRNDFAKMTLGIVGNIAQMIAKEQIASLIKQSLMQKELVQKQVVETQKQTLDATTTASSIANAQAGSTASIAAETAKTGPLATNGVLQSIASVPFPLNIAAAAATTALITTAINKFSKGGFAEGGYTGGGAKYDVKGAVHGNEYVFTSDQVNRLGLKNIRNFAKGGMPMVPVAGGGSNVNIIINNNANTQVSATQEQDEQGNLNIMVDIIENKLSSGIRQRNSPVFDAMEEKFVLNRG